MKKILLLFVIASCCFHSHAQVFSMVRDINTSAATTDFGSRPEGFINANGIIYFSAFTASTGIELWKSDGTEAGTVRVKDIYPGSIGSSPQHLVYANGFVYFTAIDGVHGRELWRTDGTEAGTMMVRDILPGMGDGVISDIVVMNNTPYFVASNGVNGVELWKSDGTRDGTVMVKDINAGAGSGSPYRMTAANGQLFFTAQTTAYGFELWKTDGTEAGTVMVRDLSPAARSTTINDMVAVDGEVYFLATVTDILNGLDFQLWKSNGTESGTVLVKSSGLTTGPFLTNVNGTLFFQGMDANGRELWKSDGTPAGTVMVKDIYPGSGSSLDDTLINVNGTLYFRARSSDTDVELWKSDGTSAGTVRVKDITPGSAGSGLLLQGGVDNTLYFVTDAVNGTELWKTDGTEAGTVMVKDINPGSGHGFYYQGFRCFAAANSTVFFSAQNATSGVELWKTDGTEGGTVMVKDIAPAATASAFDLNAGIMTAGSSVFFLADDGINGRELWRSDGTEAGTVMLKDIRAGSPGIFINGWLAVGNTLYFTTDDGINGFELWKTDGTTAGTVLVKDINPGPASSTPSGFTSYGGYVYFAATNGNSANGIELWRTDGTSAGTIMVKDISAGGGSSSPSYLTVVGSWLYFSARTGDGQELWRSDGTSAGTVMVKDINPGPGSSDPRYLCNVNGVLYFNATNGTDGYELWKSNGTSAGTVMERNIYPGTPSGNPRNLISVGGNLYFIALHPAYGDEVWVHMPPSATGLLGDIWPGAGGSSPMSLINFNNTLYFVANDSAHGHELWKFGTGGLERVTDYWPGEGSGVGALYTAQGMLFFFGNNGVSGREPVRSDGTAAGTVMIGDLIQPGDGNATQLVAAGGKMFTIVWDEKFGRELWAAPMNVALPLVITEFNARLEDRDALITWKTTDEYNTQSFDIERSVDGINFIVVGNVLSANSPGTHVYHYTDANVVALQAPVVYYRLRQVDIDGRYTYSRVVPLFIQQPSSALKVYPNPVISELTVTISLNRGEALRIRLIDNAGRIIRDEQKTLSAGTTQQSVDMRNLPAGIYHLELVSESVREHKTVLKQ